MLLERSTGQDISSSGTSYSMQKDRIVTDAEKRAVRKLDYTVIPVMTMFYLLSFLVLLIPRHYLALDCLLIFFIPRIAPILVTNTFCKLGSTG